MCLEPPHNTAWVTENQISQGRRVKPNMSDQFKKEKKKKKRKLQCKFSLVLIIKSQSQQGVKAERSEKQSKGTSNQFLPLRTPQTEWGIVYSVLRLKDISMKFQVANCALSHPALYSSLSSHITSCLHLPSAGIKGVSHHHLTLFFFQTGLSSCSTGWLVLTENPLPLSPE